MKKKIIKGKTKMFTILLIAVLVGIGSYVVGSWLGTILRKLIFNK